MTPEHETKIRIRVGFFTLVGLLIIGSMVTYFGRLGEGLKRFYPLQVEYPNASGLLRGADVVMAGAKIGRVADGPFIRPDGAGVYVELKIFEGTPIPANSVFSIGSSGLLGDRFVDITMKPQEAGRERLLEPGDTVQGKREAGMAELASEGGLMLADIREAVQRINEAAKRVNEHLLTEDTLRGISTTVSNLNATSQTLTESARRIDATVAETSGRLDSMLEETSGQLGTLLEEANAAVGEGKNALASASAAARDIQAASGDVRKMVADARKGKGVVGVLLNDEQLAENLRLFIANLRRHGVLWYRDRPQPDPSR